jgi:hypothetical protein
VADRGSRLAFLTTLALLRMRRLVRRPVYLVLGVAIAALYAVLSMLQGGMLVTYPTVSGSLPPPELYLNGAPWWNYPALLIVEPTWTLYLPLLLTVTMLLASAGVGLGMSAAVRLGVQLVRRRGRELGQPTALGALAGLTPAMIGFVLLGACCSITAGAIAGIGTVAQASGSNLDNVLLNSWYLGLFEIAVLYAALLAQEELIAVYGGLFGFQAALGLAPEELRRPAALGWRGWAATGGRFALAAGGITWLLASFTYWFEPTWFGPAPPNPSSTLWFSFLFQHALVAGAALTVAFFPSAVRRWSGAAAARIPGWGVRAALLVGGLSLLTWTPAPVASGGAFGLGNELLGFLGAPAAWGAVSPPALAPLWLAFRWAIQFALLGGLSVALALFPRGAVRWFAPEVAAPAPVVAGAGRPEPAGRSPAPPPTTAEPVAAPRELAPSPEG